MSSDPKIALLDLDGTVANYDKTMSAEMALISSPHEDPYDKYAANFGSDQPYLKHRRKLIQNQPGFWRTLEPLPLGFHIVSLLKEIGFSINVLTQGPRKCPSAWHEKYSWCQEHLPNIPVTITQDKSLSYGRVLVDDFSPYFLKWLNHRPRGLVVCVAHEWNEMFAVGGAAYQDNIFRYDGSNLAELKERLKLAFDRK